MMNDVLECKTYPMCAGFVVLCPKELKVLLVASHTSVWVFPSGKRENSEKLESCAFRELGDKTGLMASYIDPLEMSVFLHETTETGSQYCRLFVATVKNIIQPCIKDIDGLSKCKWLSYEEAYKLLTDKKADILRDAIHIIENMYDNKSVSSDIRISDSISESITADSNDSSDRVDEK